MPSSEGVPQVGFPGLRTAKSHDGVSFPRLSKSQGTASPPAPPNGYPDGNKEADDHDEDFQGTGEVTMSFEPQTPLPPSGLSRQDPGDSPENAHHLRLKPVATVPGIVSTNYLEHNAWAGENEDEGFHEDREVKMTFE
jgi:hypothetical protein